MRISVFITTINSVISLKKHILKMCYCHVLCVILCVMGKVKRLELCWQLYVTALPERDVRNIRPLVFVDSVPVDMRSVR